MDHRFVKQEDCPCLLELLRMHSKTQNLDEGFTITENDLERELFGSGSAHALFVTDENMNDKIAGFAFFYYTFSTFSGKRILFLEDLYVLPEYRGSGFGRYIMNTLSDIGKREGCAKMEWNCLRSNIPAATFYLSIGAERLSDRTSFRLYLN